jgi:hypothetical protein
MSTACERVVVALLCNYACATIPPHLTSRLKRFSFHNGSLWNLGSLGKQR